MVLSCSGRMRRYHEGCNTFAELIFPERENEVPGVLVSSKSVSLLLPLKHLRIWVTEGIILMGA